ncbi:MAG TPA: FAD-binding oxidoreductase [Candidatus Accumulibacter phosphatis]|nr:MAG: hydroxyglutarate oxidase [Candidatus Accumulibacter sp. SK-11]HCN67089.1 FAD-binding oxidoreductase [Accumulibacter sp.]HCV13892.1 FAD-binding oxidoreductase [Accumulibacter sp.]HRL77135.1 FAD-binding oxidoreductase [Candidatus Accumulibacter phosphatis]HRQ95476.1 FAD-binding oxidoreductase [Candidatus Accumulibacter phosphatis]
MAPAARVEEADFLVIGGGIAGASVAWHLARHGRVTLLERESQPGYHSTGRSAAIFAESYGPAQVRALTRASRSFLETPPAGFAAAPLLTPRGALFVACRGQEALLQQTWQSLHAAASGDVEQLGASQVCAMVPVLRPEVIIGGVYDPAAADIDVHSLHSGYLRGLRQNGGSVVCDAAVTALHHVAGRWRLSAGDLDYVAPTVVNAAGAWADTIGELAGVAAIGLQPKRRSVFIFAPPAELASGHWPLTIGVAEDWYFKPEAGMLLASPANADAVEPHDVRPEELDIATGIHRLSQVSTLSIRRPTHTWAGLRSFVSDGGLVGGFDAAAAGFFWLAAQGGYGIQTAPAMAEGCAALARGLPLPARIVAHGLTPDMLGPTRLRA